MSESRLESICKCGKKIWWLHTADGKDIPLDRTPPIYEIMDETKSLGRRADKKFAVSHFATCRNANDFSASNQERLL